MKYQRFIVLTIVLFITPITSKGFNVKEILKNSIPYEYCEKDEDLDNLRDTVKNQIKKIVIDPGHGGKDPGCVGKISYEKDIALAIALKLGARINLLHPDVEVIYTRTKDVFIPLFKRVEVANKNKADLFISIHCNAAYKKTTSGSETFVMGLHRAKENLEVAKRENQSILLENNFEENYDGYDPNSAEGHIILSMVQNAHLDRSIAFASLVEKNLEKRSKVTRGVKQAGFVVLRRATMPSVLVEAGFLTNKQEEKYLKSEQGQNEVALSLANAFTEYKKSVEEEANYFFVNSENENDTITNKTDHPIVKVQEKVRKQKVYKVQIAAYKNKPDLSGESLFSEFEDLVIKEEGGFYKILVGSYDQLQQASSDKEKLRKTGFPGAFVVSVTK